MKTIKDIFNMVSRDFPESHPVTRGALTFLVVLGATAMTTYLATELLLEGIGNGIATGAQAALDGMKTSITPPEGLVKEAMATEGVDGETPDQARGKAAGRSMLAISLMNTYNPF